MNTEEFRVALGLEPFEEFAKKSPQPPRRTGRTWSVLLEVTAAVFSATQDTPIWFVAHEKMYAARCLDVVFHWLQQLKVPSRKISAWQIDLTSPLGLPMHIFAITRAEWVNGRARQNGRDGGKTIGVVFCDHYLGS